MQIKFMFALSLGIGGFIWATQTAEAQQQNCANRAAIVEQLQTRFSETRLGMGLHPDNLIVEIFTSLDSGSWTIIATRPDGISCLVAAGESWTETTDTLPSPDPQS